MCSNRKATRLAAKSQLPPPDASGSCEPFQAILPEFSSGIVIAQDRQGRAPQGRRVVDYRASIRESSLTCSGCDCSGGNNGSQRTCSFRRGRKSLDSTGGEALRTGRQKATSTPSRSQPVCRLWDPRKHGDRRIQRPLSKGTTRNRSTPALRWGGRSQPLAHHPHPRGQGWKTGRRSHSLVSTHASS